MMLAISHAAILAFLRKCCMEYTKGMNIRWKEVFKFLAGATFAGSLANFYLSFTKIAVPFLGFTITPQLLGLRSLLQFALFLVFFYFGYLKKK
jgi:hypothetical protein